MMNMFLLCTGSELGMRKQKKKKNVCECVYDSMSMPPSHVVQININRLLDLTYLFYFHMHYKYWIANFNVQTFRFVDY